jgi:hypothetical protein
LRSIDRTLSLGAGGLAVLAAMLACSSEGDTLVRVPFPPDAGVSSGRSSSSGGSSGSSSGAGSGSGSSSGAGSDLDSGAQDSGDGLDAITPSDGAGDDGAVDLDGATASDAALDDGAASDAIADAEPDAQADAGTAGSGTCPSPPIVSCFFSSQRSCNDYTGSNANGIGSCPGGAVFSTSSCSVANPGLVLVASCDVSSGPSEYVIRYYSPFTQATALTACTQLNGTICQ